MIKSTNNASFVLSAALSSLPFTWRFFPFEFVILRGLFLESVKKRNSKEKEIHEMPITRVCKPVFSKPKAKLFKARLGTSRKSINFDFSLVNFQ